MAAAASTVLVVEDDLLVREFIVRELEDAGFLVLWAESGERAMTLAMTETFDVLLTDIRLPGDIDGWALAKAVRDRKPEIAIIYTTGYAPNRDRQLPGTKFLIKPYRVADVVAAIKEIHR